MILKKITCFIITILLFNIVCFAKMQSFTKEATEIVPPNQSQDQVIDYLTQKLTREATEEAGTFITSNLQIDNYKITKDEFTSFAGSISKVKVEEKETFTKDNNQYVRVKVNIKVDTDNVKAYLEKIMKDNEYKKQAQKAMKEAEQLRKKNLELEKKLKKASKQEYENKLALKAQQQIQEQKQQAAELNRVALQEKYESLKRENETLKKQVKNSGNLDNKKENKNVKTDSKINKQIDTKSNTKTTKKYFNIGSTMDEVKAIQGTPTSISKYIGEEIWYYGSSHINFKNNKVYEYTNHGDLHIKKEKTTKGYFNIGSTMDEVKAIQGTPTSISKYIGEEIWYYGSSHINFKNNKVYEYTNHGDLHIKKEKTTKGYFNIGSTMDEVKAIQGTPTSVSKYIGEEIWYYGSSYINFKNNKVYEYTNHGDLHIK